MELDDAEFLGKLVEQLMKFHKEIDENGTPNDDTETRDTIAKKLMNQISRRPVVRLHKNCMSNINDCCLKKPNDVRCVAIPKHLKSKYLNENQVEKAVDVSKFSHSDMDLPLSRSSDSGLGLSDRFNSPSHESSNFSICNYQVQQTHPLECGKKSSTTQNSKKTNKDSESIKINQVTDDNSACNLGPYTLPELLEMMRNPKNFPPGMNVGGFSNRSLKIRPTEENGRIIIHLPKELKYVCDIYLESATNIADIMFAPVLEAESKIYSLKTETPIGFQLKNETPFGFQKEMSEHSGFHVSSSFSSPEIPQKVEVVSTFNIPNLTRNEKRRGRKPKGIPESKISFTHHTSVLATTPNCFENQQILQFQADVEKFFRSSMANEFHAGNVHPVKLQTANKRKSSQQGGNKMPHDTLQQVPIRVTSADYDSTHFVNLSSIPPLSLIPSKSQNCLINSIEDNWSDEPLLKKNCRKMEEQKSATKKKQKMTENKKVLKKDSPNCVRKSNKKLSTKPKPIKQKKKSLLGKTINWVKAKANIRKPSEAPKENLITNNASYLSALDMPIINEATDQSLSHQALAEHWQQGRRGLHTSGSRTSGCPSYNMYSAISSTPNGFTNYSPEINLNRKKLVNGQNINSPTSCDLLERFDLGEVGKAFDGSDLDYFLGKSEQVPESQSSFSVYQPSELDKNNVNDEISPSIDDIIVNPSEPTRSNLMENCFASIINSSMHLLNNKEVEFNMNNDQDQVTSDDKFIYLTDTDQTMDSFKQSTNYVPSSSNINSKSLSEDRSTNHVLVPKSRGKNIDALRKSLNLDAIPQSEHLQSPFTGFSESAGNNTGYESSFLPELSEDDETSTSQEENFTKNHKVAEELIEQETLQGEKSTETFENPKCDENFHMGPSKLQESSDDSTAKIPSQDGEVSSITLLEQESKLDAILDFEDDCISLDDCNYIYDLDSKERVNNENLPNKINSQSSAPSPSYHTPSITSYEGKNSSQNENDGNMAADIPLCRSQNMANGNTSQFFEGHKIVKEPPQRRKSENFVVKRKPRQIRGRLSIDQMPKLSLSNYKIPKIPKESTDGLGKFSDKLTGNESNSDLQPQRVLQNSQKIRRLSVVNTSQARRNSLRDNRSVSPQLQSQVPYNPNINSFQSATNKENNAVDDDFAFEDAVSFVSQQQVEMEIETPPMDEQTYENCNQIENDTSYSEAISNNAEDVLLPMLSGHVSTIRDMALFFGVTCFPSLIDQCSGVGCPDLHEMRDAGFVSLMLQSLSMYESNMLLKFACRYKKLISHYMVAFSDYYTKSNNLNGLCQLLTECQRYENLCETSISVLYQSFLNCGLDKPCSCFLTLKYSTSRSTVTINALLHIIMDSDWTLFADNVRELINMPAAEVSVALVEKMFQNPLLKDNVNDKVEEILAECFQKLSDHARIELTQKFVSFGKHFQ